MSKADVSRCDRDSGLANRRVGKAWSIHVAADLTTFWPVAPENITSRKNLR